MRHRAVINRRLRGVSAQEIVPPPPPSGTQTVTFMEDTVNDFMNPERGWMLRELHTSSTFANMRNGDSDNPVGYTMNWSYMTGTPFNGTPGTNPFRLDNYATSDIPASLLTELNTVFANARTAGIKMKVRFAYNYSSSGNDTTEYWMLRHIAQLAPTVNANRDVVAMLDAGFIGRWGEWNYPSGTIGNLVLGKPGASTQWWNEPYLTAYCTVYQKIIDEFHPDIMVGFRYPRDDRGYRLFFNGAGGDRVAWSAHDHEANRFDGSAISRTGWYSDCLWTSRDHSTFNLDGGEIAIDIRAFGESGRVAATSGETCSMGGLNSYNDGSFVLDPLAESSAIVIGGPDHLYRKFWADIYTKWINSGHYAEISRRLGYRIHLNSVTLPTELTMNTTATLSVEWKNAGFGKVYNPRPMDLILVGNLGAFTIRISSDVRRQLPLAGDTTTASWEFNVPGGLQANSSYDAYLRFPDPDPVNNNLDLDERYTLRLATLKDGSPIWNGTNGRHNLNLSVTARVASL